MMLRKIVRMCAKGLPCMKKEMCAHVSSRHFKLCLDIRALA